MTTNQTIDGVLVSRELLYRVSDPYRPKGQEHARAELRALLESEPCAKSQAEPDPMLCKFYDVTDWPGLVRELVGHVAQLQDSAKRNVKPWEDTFPPTLLPAYIDRVNAENAAAQTQGDPVAWMFKYISHSDSPPYRSFEVTDFHQNPKAPGIAQHTPLYAEQPSPVVVTLPAQRNSADGRHDERVEGYNEALADVRRAISFSAKQL